MRALLLAIFCISIGAVGSYAVLSKNPELILSDLKDEESFKDFIARETEGIFEEAKEHSEKLVKPKYKEETANYITYVDMLKVETIPNLLSLPYTLRGEAVGNWYFEGTFPILIKDSEGNTVLETYATATEEWMTEEFVPFETTLMTEDSLSGSYILVLQKNNPSGIEEFNDSFEIEINI